ncbi:MAG TPA: hypothetical protein V6C81_05080 [Planktothrix sp.]
MHNNSTHVAEYRLEEQQTSDAPKEGLRNFLADANREGISQIEMSELINRLPSHQRDSITVSAMGDIHDNPLAGLTPVDRPETQSFDSSPAAVERIADGDKFFEKEPTIVGDSHRGFDTTDNTAHAARTGFAHEIDEHGNLHQRNLDGSTTITTPQERLHKLQHLTANEYDFQRINGHSRRDLQYYFYLQGRPDAKKTKDSTSEEPVLTTLAKRPKSEVLQDVVLAPGAMVGALPERPFSLVSVHDLKIDKRDGAVVLVTNNGTALLKENGAPVTAQELGKFMQSDGSIAVAAHGQPIAAGALHDFGPPKPKTDSAKPEQEKPAGPPMFTNYFRKFDRTNVMPPPPVADGTSDSGKQAHKLYSRPLRQIIKTRKVEANKDASAEETQQKEDVASSESNNLLPSKDDEPKGFEQREIARRAQLGRYDPAPATAQTQAPEPASAPGDEWDNMLPHSSDSLVEAESKLLLEDFQLDDFQIVFNPSQGAA